METTKQLGRPVNLTSRRQIELAEKAEKRALGLVKRGRPIDPTSKHAQEKANKGESTGKRGRPVIENSKHHQAIQQKKAKIEAGWVSTGQRGRPVVSDSERQKKIAERLEKISQGFQIKPGRPKVREAKLELV